MVCSNRNPRGTVMLISSLLPWAPVLASRLPAETDTAQPPRPATRAIVAHPIGGLWPPECTLTCEECDRALPVARVRLRGEGDGLVVRRVLGRARLVRLRLLGRGAS